jgi:hypothetical protein
MNWPMNWPMQLPLLSVSPGCTCGNDGGCTISWCVAELVAQRAGAA